ncbi:hypothetical protein SUGI_1092610 [Cryptomeria japonica]|nr:hypothetical protein SUGI_1092610 [Cryptomeria japonica]
MADKRRKQAVSELDIEEVDSEKRYIWFENVKGSFEYHRAEVDTQSAHVSQGLKQRCISASGGVFGPFPSHDVSDNV